MASDADIDADLTLEIDGRNVTPEKFMKGVRAFFGLVNEITRDLAGPKDFVHWAVQVKRGSNLIGLVPMQANIPASKLDTIYARIHEGIASLENSSEEPEGIPEPALKHIRDLASIAGTDPDEGDDTKVRVWAKRLPAPVTHKAVAHVAVLLAESYEDLERWRGVFGLHPVPKTPS
jgi:hypothetical protein